MDEDESSESLSGSSDLPDLVAMFACGRNRRE